jgi:hypothetical protein
VLETTTIRDPRAAAVFAAPRQRKLLLAVIEEARSGGSLELRSTYCTTTWASSCGWGW